MDWPDGAKQNMGQGRIYVESRKAGTKEEIVNLEGWNSGTEIGF